jgi:hypothetical protein
MSLSREQTFELWTPPASPWVIWAKPVLFAFLPARSSEPHDEGLVLPRAPRADWAPPADGRTALVVDLPGVLSVRLAEALVHRGFRPIPLFNAVAGPHGVAPDPDDPAGPLVDVYPIAEAIQVASARLFEPLRALPPEAPPAFLLHADRREGRRPEHGAFDNRSLSLPTDFPSAAFLQSRGISRVLLVIDVASMLSTAGQPATDLAHTLLRWQKAGISLESCGVDDNLALQSPADRITVESPRWFRAVWHNALSVLGLRRNPMGGFGGRLPIPSGSSGWSGAGSG